MITLNMPATSGSREGAREFTQHLSLDLEGIVVLVDASGMKASAQSFGDELVQQILVVRNAEKMVVEAPTRLFARRIKNSARVQEVEDKLVVSSER